MNGDQAESDFRTRDQALEVLRAIRDERADEAGETSPVGEPLLETVFAISWDHQFDRDRRALKQAVAQAVTAAIASDPDAT